MLASITFNEANYLKEKKCVGGGGDHAHDKALPTKLHPGLNSVIGLVAPY